MSTINSLDDSPEVVNEPQPKKSIFSSNLLIVLILFVIALSEMLAAYFFILPSPSKVKGEIETTMNKEANTNTPYKADIPTDIQKEEREEVDLGEFTLIIDDVASVPFRISIHFFGLVNKKEIEEYNKRYKIHQNRIREAILVIVRSSPHTEITEPSLGVLKNRITVKINDILGMPLIKGVIYTDFAISTAG